MNESVSSQPDRARQADHEIAFHAQERYKYWQGFQALDEVEKGMLKFPPSAIDEKLDEHEKTLISLGNKYGEDSIFSERLLQKILDT